MGALNLLTGALAEKIQKVMLSLHEETRRIRLYYIN